MTVPRNSHSLRLSTLAALVLFGAGAVVPAAAADFGDADYDYSRAVKQPRHVDNDYDEDNGYAERRRGHWGGHHIHRIEARASYAGDYAPYYVKEWRAKRSAIEAWKTKVANRFGQQFSNWRAATDKQVNCDGGAGTIYCTVSARLAQGWSRWGWYGEGRNRY